MKPKSEFYNTPDGAVCCKPEGEPVFVYDEKRKDITDEMIATIRNLYPSAFAALSELYSKSTRNREFFEYRIVHRFIRCNFGEYDALNFDINARGEFNFENVKCPLRGECPYEHIICNPQMNTELSQREKEIADLLAEGLTRPEVANELCISPFTFDKHIANIKAKLRVKTTAQIISKSNKYENSNP